MIRLRDVREHVPEPRLLNQIKRLMTPLKVVAGELVTESPEPILVPNYPSFDDLLARRRSIKNLQLVPLKSDTMYAYYHTFTKEQLAAEVDAYFQRSLILLADNAYPYDLPTDTKQRIVWCASPLVDRSSVMKFIARCVMHLKLDVNEIILFERPLNVTTRLVRGTVPQFPHVHLWSRA